MFVFSLYFGLKDYILGVGFRIRYNYRERYMFVIRSVYIIYPPSPPGGEEVGGGGVY